jgi:hypothetical protein
MLRRECISSILQRNPFQTMPSSKSHQRGFIIPLYLMSHPTFTQKYSPIYDGNFLKILFEAIGLLKVVDAIDMFRILTLSQAREMLQAAVPKKFAAGINLICIALK